MEQRTNSPFPAIDRPVMAVVGVVLAFGMRRTAPGLALAWGLVWVGVERLTAQPASTLVGVTALVAAAVSAGCAVAVALRRTA